MEVFLNIIIFLVLAMLLAKLLFRYLAPWLLKRFVQKRMKEFGGEFQNFEQEYQSREGKDFGNISKTIVSAKMSWMRNMSISRK